LTDTLKNDIIDVHYRRCSMKNVVVEVRNYGIYFFAAAGLSREEADAALEDVRTRCRTKLPSSVELREGVWKLEDRPPAWGIRGYDQTFGKPRYQQCVLKLES
jgi:hypothetical protein